MLSQPPLIVELMKCQVFPTKEKKFNLKLWTLSIPLKQKQFVSFFELYHILTYYIFFFFNPSCIDVAQSCLVSMLMFVLPALLSVHS